MFQAQIAERRIGILNDIDSLSIFDEYNSLKVELVIHLLIAGGSDGSPSFPKPYTSTVEPV